MDKKIKDTHLVISLGLLVIYVISNWREMNHPAHNWLLYTSAGISFVGFAIPPLARIIHTVWFWIGDKMGFVVSKILLGTLFIVLLIPVGLISRIFKKDLMFMKGSKSSCYLERDHIYSTKDFENPW